MTLRLKLLLRVVKRRVDAGEKLDAVLRDYPRLSEAEKKLMQGLGPVKIYAQNCLQAPAE